MRQRRQRIVSSIILAAVCLMTTGCGRTYAVIGIVVAVPVGDSATPGIREVAQAPAPRPGGIATASVTLFHELASDGKPDRTSPWQRSVDTNADGSFELYSYATPGRRNTVGLEVSAPGYRTEYTTYVDFIDPNEQYFVVFLSPAG